MNAYTLNIGGSLMSLEKPAVMGIVNVTPDSFYAASRTQADDDIAARMRQIVAEGGTIIDIGGCSTRPGSSPVEEQEEADRLCRGLAIARRVAPAAALSIDTFRPSVARLSVEKFGACILNDISGGCEEMYQAAAELHVPYVLTYNNPTPRFGDVAADCLYFLAERIARLHDLGVCDIIVDPGFGFNKTLEQNHELLASLEQLHELGQPVLVGLSRKSMICRLLGCEPQKALNGSSVLHTIALQKGAHILRVHDVREAAEAVTLTTNLKPQTTNRIQCFSHSL